MGARVVLSFDEAIVREAELAKPVTVVGRHCDCDLVIDDAAVSGRHLLFRVVDQTVYVEDLASTNGTRVNGLPVDHQVMHHLDIVEVGRHKLHFFEDSLLAGRVKGLESTILTAYERTMMSDLATARRSAPARRADDDLSMTLAIERDPALRLEPAHDGGRTGKPQAPGPVLALQVLRGERKGATIALERANTMIGDPGTETALVVRRGCAHFLARFAGQRPPRLNGKELGAGTHQISSQDVIDVGAMSFQVVEVA